MYPSLKKNLLAFLLICIWQQPISGQTSGWIESWDMQFAVTGTRFHKVINSASTDVSAGDTLQIVFFSDSLEEKLFSKVDVCIRCGTFRLYGHTIPAEKLYRIFMVEYNSFWDYIKYYPEIENRIFLVYKADFEIKEDREKDCIRAKKLYYKIPDDQFSAEQ